MGHRRPLLASLAGRLLPSGGVARWATVSGQRRSQLSADPLGGPKTQLAEDLRSILLGTAGLSVAALLALFFTVTRGHATSSRAELQGAARVAGIVVLIQCAHFAEELATGFHRRFPEQLGLAPWSPYFFISFNLFWLVVWVLSCRGLVAGRQPAVAALWFLAIAGLANGVAHPLLSAWAGSYFPGVITSPFLGIAGLLLLRRLASVTCGPAAARGAGAA